MNLHAKDSDSRVEKILSATLGNYDKPLPNPQSRVEEYLLAIKNQGGGGGGTTDYSALVNKPAINGHTLEGSLTAEGIGLEPDQTVIYDSENENVTISYDSLNSLLGH